MDYESEGLELLQTFMRTRPTLIIGSGLSVSMGLPGMGELLDHLIKKIPQHFSPGSVVIGEWEDCLKLIRDYGFEEGLTKITITEELLSIIVDETGQLIEQHDRELCGRLFAGSAKDFPLVKLLNHILASLPPGDPILNVVTPNYDHLVEYACEILKIECNTGFLGTLVGRFIPDILEEDEYIQVQVPDKGRIKKEFRKIKKVRLLKPHGSIYWQQYKDEVYQSPVNLVGSTRVIITPGRTKYENSLVSFIMNSHRENANQAIRRAESLLIIGYGFNDNHLQTTLMDRLSSCTQCLILTRTLSDNAKKVIASYPQVIGLEKGGDVNSSLWYYRGGNGQWPEPIWSLDHFVDKVI